jgi:hypothetical protein
MCDKDISGLKIKLRRTITLDGKMSFALIAGRSVAIKEYVV